MSSDVIYKYSAGGVVLDGNKVLVISSELRNSVGLPKGKIDKGETPEATAVREVKEETGYDVEIVDTIGDYTFEFDWTDGKHHIKTVKYYVMKLANNHAPEPNLQPGEDFEVKWLESEEALEQFTYDEAKDALRVALKSTRPISS